MTAEIAILNRHAVALAADSAVTIGNSSGAKVYNTVNKLFALSYNAPVGIMIYGGADICGVPWEVVIKEYRTSLGSQRFDHLNQYCQSFCDFLDLSGIFTSDIQKLAVAQESVAFLANLVFTPIAVRIHGHFEEHGEITQAQVTAVISAEVRAVESRFLAMPDAMGFAAADVEAVQAEYSTEIQEAVDAVFENLPLGRTNRKRLHRLVALSMTKDHFSSGMSGVVIAGYGEKQFFPAIAAYDYEGVYIGKPKRRLSRASEIGPENVSVVVPFAQREMVNLFMEGVDPTYRLTVESALNTFVEGLPEIIADAAGLSGAQRDALATHVTNAASELVVQFQDQLTKYSYAAHVIPIINAVSALPKDELGAMAEALVNLTSFKRRVTLDPETVGGAIDVAVISKGDGLIWLKRKHYFDPNSNPQYFARFR